ncbi:unnamed protein product [Xylocopa violacea]|uniref:Uncharacterized protein n=1 Tax=Xylocopa violacea TaxID=135666 RepID=A0ABP1NWU9_XYLVO
MEHRVCLCIRVPLSEMREKILEKNDGVSYTIFSNKLACNFRSRRTHACYVRHSCAKAIRMELDRFLINGPTWLPARNLKSNWPLSAARSTSDSPIREEKGKPEYVSSVSRPLLCLGTRFAPLSRSRKKHLTTSDGRLYLRTYLWQVNRVRCPSRWVPLLEKAL